jgi:hypothetical protein
VGLGEFDLVLRSRALANTNHQAIKLQRRLDGCDGPSTSRWLRVYCPSDQVSIRTTTAWTGRLTCPSDQEVKLRNRRRVQGRLNTRGGIQHESDKMHKRRPVAESALSQQSRMTQLQARMATQRSSGGAPCF